MIGVLLVLGLASAAALREVTYLLPVEAKTTLLNYAHQNGVQSISEATPIYRADLDLGTAPYWQVITDKGDYLVISSGPQTGDHKIVMEGKMPPPTDLLADEAKQRGHVCLRYFMLAPGGIMMCENEAGRIVATTHDPFIMSMPQAKDEGKEIKHAFLETVGEKLASHWNHHRDEVTKLRVWNSANVYDKYNSDPAQVTEERLALGDHSLISVGNNPNIYVRFISSDNNNTVSGQRMLCTILKLCKADNDFEVDKSKIKVSPIGIRYIKLEPEMSKYDNFEDEISFKVEVPLRNGSVYIRRFGLDLRKVRRQTVSSSATILDETYFPEYDQHMLSERHCYVGCGPVSWAMIFGYYDRRSHGNPSKYGTQAQALWRCGPTGNEANNSCIAPSRNTDTLKRYTEHLNEIMGTFCIGDQGATPQWKMDDVVDYFKDRMQGTNPTIEAHHDWLLSDVGLYEDKFRDSMMKFIQSGWPTVVGIRVEGVFSQHYPVASRFKQHTSHTRSCIHKATPSDDGLGENGRSCGQWRSATEYDMYLHMGWGGSQNGWRKAGMFFAAAAKYDLPSTV